MKEDWHHLYKTKAWLNMRRQVLAHALYRCVICDGRANVVDHIKAHKGDHYRFFDMNNLQAVCKSCHDSHCQKRDLAALKPETGLDGWIIE
jgi:5-methylcytosine-specific restriction protein A